MANYGHAGPMFVRYLLRHRTEWTRWRQLYDDEVMRYSALGQGSPVAHRIALAFAAISIWSLLWPKVHKLEERRDVGQALSPEQERRLLDAADQNRSPNVRAMVRVSLLTGLRAGEISHLTWRRTDLGSRVVTVGDAKTEAGRGRQIDADYCFNW